MNQSSVLPLGTTVTRIDEPACLIAQNYAFCATDLQGRLWEDLRADFRFHLDQGWAVLDEIRDIKTEYGVDLCPCRNIIAALKAALGNDADLAELAELAEIE